jgi:shikimate dehydrogenase
MKRYGLIGKSLKHSFSKQFFTDYFEQKDIQAQYELYEIASLSSLQQLIEDEQLSGINVTIPFKETIFPYLDEIDIVAQQIGAVNTVAISQGRKIGYNTDVFGFRQMIKPFLLNTHQKALIIGNGGAAKAVKYVLKTIGVDVVVAARHPLEGEFSLEEVNQWMLQFCTLVVNCTPLGTTPHIHECPPIPLHYFSEQHLVIDLIYNPAATMLLQAAKKQGAITLNGLTMLKEQALKAWEIWEKANQ